MPSGRDYQVVEIPEHRYEVGNQINWIERAGRHSDRGDLRVPRNARIATGEVERMNVALDGSGPLRKGLDGVP